MEQSSFVTRLRNLRDCEDSLIPAMSEARGCLRLQACTDSCRPWQLLYLDWVSKSILSTSAAQVTLRLSSMPIIPHHPPQKVCLNDSSTGPHIDTLLCYHFLPNLARQGLSAGSLLKQAQSQSGRWRKQELYRQRHFQWQTLATSPPWEQMPERWLLESALMVTACYATILIWDAAVPAPRYCQNITSACSKLEYEQTRGVVAWALGKLCPPP